MKNVVYQFSEKRCRPNVPSRPLKRRLRRRLIGPRINVWPTPFFGKLKKKNFRFEGHKQKDIFKGDHFQLLKGHKQKGKIEREKGWKKRSLTVSWKGTKRDFQGRLNTGSMPIEKFVFVFGKLNECKISDWKKQMP